MAFPKRFSMQRLVPSGSHGYIRNLGRFVKKLSNFMYTFLNLSDSKGNQKAGS